MRVDFHINTFLAGYMLRYSCLRYRHEFLPHSGCDSGLFRCVLPAPYGSSLRPGCPDLLLQRLACRQDGREILSHHVTAVLCTHRIYHCCDDYNDRAKVLRYDAYDWWELCILCSASGVDLEHAAPTTCEGDLDSFPRRSHTDARLSVLLPLQPSMLSQTVPRYTPPTCIQSQPDRATVRIPQPRKRVDTNANQSLL